MRGRIPRCSAAIGLLLALGACQWGNRTSGYPDDYAKIERAAERETELVIWSAIDRAKANALVADFEAGHPGIRVIYREMPARELNDEFISGSARGAATADFLWSSAMDLQIKLVNDGYAQSYVSPERGFLPDWANWKDQAWGTTAEPILMVYNKGMISETEVPRTHDALTRMLEGAGSARSNLIAMSDPVTSAVGYLYLTQDADATHDIWRMVRAMGVNRVHLFDSAEGVLQDVINGRAAIGYNIVGSYALGEIGKHPRLGIIIPRDYTLLMSRIAVIPASARHPAAARLFLDFLLSRRGQTHLVRNNMASVRADIRNPPALQEPGVPLRAIRVGPALLVSQDQLTRRYFLKRWNAAIRPAPDAVVN